MGGIAARVIKASQMPLHVIRFRLFQEIRLGIFTMFHLWLNLDKRISKLSFASKQNGITLTPVLLCPDAHHALRHATDVSPFLKKQLNCLGKDILQGKYELLGSPVPQLENINWHEDWRFGKIWAPQYYKKYSFYGKRSEPYDIKFPWELSRLQFVIPLLQNAILFPDNEIWLATAQDIIDNWCQENPLAQSVAWNPMESSMRITSLVLMLDMALILSTENPVAINLVETLGKAIARHAHFVWETREYTVNRGNHYAANIAALCLAGLALRKAYPTAAKWLQFASSRINDEIISQFCSDGVNFEKSTGYHYLVTELFLTSAIAMDKAGMTLSRQAAERLKKACQFSRDMRRPDGWSVNFGDTDNAVVLAFSGAHPRNQASLINVGAAWFQVPSLRVEDWHGDLAELWIFGKNEPTQPFSRDTFCHHYQSGGYVAAQKGGGHFVMDIGEVGQNGCGGHGHNDLTSFELSLRGQPIIVDAGSPTYTGNEAKRNAFRSSFSHNILTIDSTEIAEMSGFWQIQNTALPLHTCVKEAHGSIIVDVSHSGYNLHTPPVECGRRVKADLDQGLVICTDWVKVQAVCRSERRFHLASGLSVLALGENSLDLQNEEGKFEISWEEGAEAELQDCSISDGFGHENPSHVLVLRNTIHSDREYRVTIKEI